MKRSISLLLAATWVCLGQTDDITTDGKASSGGKIQLTLLEAKKIALKQNPTLAKAKAAIESASAQVGQAKAAYWPTLDVNASIKRNRDKATRPLRDYEQNTNYSTDLSLNWLIFDGFSRKLTLMDREYSLQSSIEADKDAQRLLLQAVSSSFYAVILAQDGMDIAQQDADYNRMILEDAKKRQEGGIATPSEVLNFELQVQNAEVDYITAKKNWRVAIVALSALLNMPQDTFWDSVEIIPPPPEAINIELSLENLLEYAKRNRPDIRIAQNNIALAENAIQAAKSTWYPSINLFMDYGFDRDHSAHFNTHYDRNITFGVAANWNLFNGFKTRAYIAQGYAELDKAIEAKNELLLDIDADVRKNYLALESNRHQLTAQEKILATAQKIRDLVREEYRGGTSTITRLNEAQTDVTISASARSQAYVQVLSSLEAISASTGGILDLNLPVLKLQEVSNP